MNWKTWIPLVLAIVLGVVAAKVARDTLAKNRGNQTAGKFIKVVVTKNDIPPGQDLKKEDLTLSEVQADSAPANSFKTVEELSGRVSEILILKGQPVVNAMLTQEGSGSGLQALVPPGMRAITMEVNEFSGLAGLITPNSRVDILATLSDPTTGGQISRTIVQNIQVKAVGQRTTLNSNEPPNPNEIYRSITILVSLADAEAVELACSSGRPRLVLRGGRDNEIVASAGISTAELRGQPKQATAVAAVPTSQPAVAATATSQPSEETVAVAHKAPQRMVKFIRAGVVSNIALDVLDGNSDDTNADTKKEMDPFDNQ